MVAQRLEHQHCFAQFVRHFPPVDADARPDSSVRLCVQIPELVVDARLNSTFTVRCLRFGLTRILRSGNHVVPKISEDLNPGP